MIQMPNTDHKRDKVSTHIHGSVPLLGRPVIVPPGWPKVPKQNKTSVHWDLASGFIDLVLLMFSIVFFVFALVVRQLNEVPTQLHPHTTSTLLSATRYGPTVFPILFATVFSRATHAILMWRLEQGERISTLDMLSDSTSLTSTVMSQVRLRTLGALGITLMAIWAMSPVGGQASIRQMSIGTKRYSQPATFKYIAPTSSPWTFDSGTSRAQYTAIVNSLFLSALVGPATTKSSPRDAWGNVKIPIIETYETESNGMEPEGWYARNSTPGPQREVYASLIGVPVSGINSPSFVDYNMSIESSYLKLNCSTIGMDSPKRTGQWVPKGAFNITNKNYNMYLSWFDNSSSTGLTTNRSQVPSEMLSPFVFTYASVIGSNWTTCSLTTTYVEVEIFCPTSTGCAVSRLRRSRRIHPPPAATLLDLPAFVSMSTGTNMTGPSNWNLLASNLLSSVGGRPDFQTLLDFYLVAPDNPTNVTDSQPTAGNFEIRFGQLLNAYWDCVTRIFVVTGGITDDTTKPDANADTTSTSLPKTQDGQTSASTWSTTGVNHRQTEVIRAHTGWVITLCVASAILILASLIPPFARIFLTQGPDLMINISSLATRNNPHMLLPATGSYLDPPTRSKLLKDVWIRFGDIDGKADSGSLAFGRMIGDEYDGVQRVRKGRFYE